MQYSSHHVRRRLCCWLLHCVTTTAIMDCHKKNAGNKVGGVWINGIISLVRLSSLPLLLLFYRWWMVALSHISSIIASCAPSRRRWSCRRPCPHLAKSEFLILQEAPSAHGEMMMRWWLQGQCWQEYRIMNKSCILQPLLPHTGNKYSSSWVHKKVHRSTSSSPSSLVTLAGECERAN